jgi:hypothetical protein
MFREDSFMEGKSDSATLYEVDGIVSVASFETLVQWLYRGTVNFPPLLAVSDEIAKVIEFVRLADMYHVTGMEQTMADHIKVLLREKIGTLQHSQIAARGNTEAYARDVQATRQNLYFNSYGSALAANHYLLGLFVQTTSTPCQNCLKDTQYE